MNDKEKEIDIRDANLINLILKYVIEHEMSMESLEKCVDKVAEAFYSDGLIKFKG